MTKEFEKLLNSIEKWVKVNDENVTFVGSFIAFDEQKMKENADDIFKEDEDRMVAFGDKETLLIALDGLKEQIEESKDDFINW